MPTLSITCLCTTNIHIISLPSSLLPLSTYLCSCNISRRISGSLLTSYINIPGLKPDTSHCTAYQSSDILKRWFCSKCGTQLYLEYEGDGHFEVVSGIVGWGRDGNEDGEGDRGAGGKEEERRGTDGLVRFEGVMWIDDTKDGGATVWLDGVSGKVLERWKGEAGQSTRIVPRSPRISHEDQQGEQSAQKQRLEPFDKPIYAHCHCKGVEFWITPPNQTSSTDSSTTKSPYPDLLIPHYLNNSANPQNEPWWLVDHGTKYLAGTCTCNTCRLASGFDITFWAFIPTANIFLDAECLFPFTTPESPWPPSQYWGTMQSYQSSPGVTRTFCGKCGANVFFVGDEERLGRRGLVDVAVGLLDAGTGARAEEGLGWCNGRVSFVEEARHEGLGRELERGLRNWGEEKKKGE